MGAVLNLTVTFDLACDCITCGVPIVMPDGLKTELLRNHRNFYCINGHSQHWPGKSDIEKLREELEAKERARAAASARADLAERSRDAYKGKVTEIKNRVGNGVCPCCKRSFTNLRRHMGTKHPDFKHEPA